jgi:hypothetical protein
VSEGGGGTVNVPKVGPVKKPVVITIALAGVAYVGWRYYQDRQAAAADTGDASTDGSFEDGGTIPAVDGAYTGQSVGLPDTSGTAPGTGDYGFTGSTNSQWTQYAATQLSMSGNQDYSAILVTLGQYLAGKPLSTAQQQTVQAAIAVAGNPPEGAHPIIPGGDTPLTIAPAGLVASGITSTTANLSWQPVAGAAHYRVYRADLGKETVGESNDPNWQARGLSGGRTYQFQVAAVSASGANGPMSGPVTVKTPAVRLAAPAGLRVTATTATTASLTWQPVPGASGYRMYRSDTGQESAGDSRDPAWQARGLRAGTTYTIYVHAVDNNGTNGPAASVRVTTKKK